jgi:OOP family OmpA-OmpF porin
MRRLFLLAALTLVAGTAAADPLPHIVVFFNAWSARLDPAAMQAIQDAADWAKQHPDAPLTVIGYASSVGSVAANHDLARLRAQIVTDTLVADGVAASRIRHAARGPVDFTLDPEEARRVEIARGAD